MQAYQISLIIAFALAIAEMVTLSFILLGFGIGMLFVALVQFFAGEYSLGRDVVVFAVCSAIAIVGFRKHFRHSSDQKQLAQDDINQY